MVKTTNAWPEAIDISDLSDRHKRALLRFVEKYKRGAQEHGDLQPGQRWTSDMLNERIDENFYAIFELLEIEDHDE